LPDIRTKRFEPKNPDYRAVATATFEAQRAIKTLGISLARLEPGAPLSCRHGHGRKILL
jgi:hypothetical protein